jgi:hypothetical protein
VKLALLQNIRKQKNSLLWNITLYIPLKFNRGGTFLHLQGRRISKGIKQDLAGGEEALLATCFMLIFFLGLIFDPENGSDIFLRNVC